MIDFDEELKKFHPSPELDEVEDNVERNKPTDITDLLQELLQEIKNADNY